MGTTYEQECQRDEVIYVYVWGGLRFGGKRKGHKCRVLWRGGMNSAVVEWLTGGRDVISRNALRRVRPS